MELLDEINEKVSLFKNFYDSIRIVDPIKKKASNVSGKEMMTDSNCDCYALWKKGQVCKNCVSFRALLKKDTFVKVEYDSDRVILVIATPIERNGKIHVVEILKDITKNSTFSHRLTEDSKIVEELITSLNDKSVKDELTGIYNRRYINERLPVDINYSKDNSLPLSIIMADIDFFKKVNDKYGHITGDKLLSNYSKLLTKSIRSNIDWVGRYGGEEFLIVLNGTDVKGAHSLAEKIRKTVEDTTFEYDQIKINMTSSFGVYGITGENIEINELIAKVDENLYKAKTSGRNKTVSSEGNTDEYEMVHLSTKEIKLSKLRDKINELRETLNEIACTCESSECQSERLTISQNLDELIVKYMKEVND